MGRTVCIDYGTEKRERLEIYTGDLCALPSDPVAKVFSVTVCSTCSRGLISKKYASEEYSNIPGEAYSNFFAIFTTSLLSPLNISSDSEEDANYTTF
jgi:hypothetical protein